MIRRSLAALLLCSYLGLESSAFLVRAPASASYARQHRQMRMSTVEEDAAQVQVEAVPQKSSSTKSTGDASASAKAAPSQPRFAGVNKLAQPAVAPKGDVEKKTSAILVVDPYSSGGILARKIYDRGYKVVRVLSQSAQGMIDQSLPAACKGMDFTATIQDKGDVDATLQQIRDLNMDFTGFLCGAEPGVELFDSIATRWGGHILNNGEELSDARRDKYLMGERVRDAGLRAVKQRRAGSWEEAEEFFNQLYPESKEGMKVILKPVRSSSSEDVVLAESMEEAKKAFQKIKGKANQYGDINDVVLVQEYMSGKEYVVNCVSHNGEHKVVSYWEYDKRAVNGGKFVYFGVNLYESADGEREKGLAKYIKGVIDALDIKHGPTHAEVMWLDNEDQPCLVEIGCRAHGGDGVHTELANRCIGYNQLDCMIDLIEDPAKFQAVPEQPPKLMAHASVVMLVSYEEGTLKSYPGLEIVKQMPSFKNMEIKLKPGMPLLKTVDYLSNPGWIMLVNEDAAQLKADFAKIHELEEKGLMYETEERPHSSSSSSNTAEAKEEVAQQ